MYLSFSTFTPEQARRFDITTCTEPAGFTTFASGVSTTAFDPYIASKAENVLVNATMTAQHFAGSPQLIARVVVNGSYQEQFVNVLDPGTNWETITISSALTLNPNDQVEIQLLSSGGDFILAGGSNSKLSIISSNILVPEPASVLIVLIGCLSLLCVHRKRLAVRTIEFG